MAMIIKTMSTKSALELAFSDAALLATDELIASTMRLNKTAVTTKIVSVRELCCSSFTMC
jgi:hypothetical protein